MLLGKWIKIYGIKKRPKKFGRLTFEEKKGFLTPL
jgi:hypothetical protein